MAARHRQHFGRGFAEFYASLAFDDVLTTPEVEKADMNLVHSFAYAIADCEGTIQVQQGVEFGALPAELCTQWVPLGAAVAFNGTVTPALGSFRVAQAVDALRIVVTRVNATIGAAPEVVLWLKQTDDNESRCG